MKTENHPQVTDGIRSPNVFAADDVTRRMEKLKAAVSLMDELSQKGLDQISAIAKLAMLSLETRGGNGSIHLETLAAAFSAICNISDDIQNSINHSAEEVECNFKDEHTQARYKACRERTQAGAALHQEVVT